MRLRHDPKLLRHVTDPKEFGRVAVLLGGTSSEREISLKSGNACLAALLKRGVDAHGFDPKEKPLTESPADMENCLERLGLPLIVKPATQGSSVGMTKVEKAEQLLPAYQAAAMLEPTVFAEPWITGGEYTVAVLQGRALPSIRIETPATFYDYEAKYFRNDTKYSCPSGLSVEAEKHLANLALATFNAVGAEGWGRVDFMMDKAGKPYLLEVNLVPGMTDHSLVPMAARALDINFEQLVWQVLETSFTRTP
ncbi:MAG: D-alanine--D-alanine ligase [Steroidobacteraceae bacterium]|nr:D-alanine--D-alanine ligase [Steroidobacteraceae bacterium]